MEKKKCKKKNISFFISINLFLKKRLATISPPQSFGEASLVLQRPTRVSVIADTDDVCIHSIEGYFINMAFTMKEGFAGRFYKYLCTMMARRIFKTPLSYDYESK